MGARDSTDALVRTPRPPCFSDATALLKAHGFSVDRVLRVEPATILFVNESRQAKTAYILKTEKLIRLHVEDGFLL